MSRKLIGSGSPYEDILGFSRAVRVGNYVAVGGTAPIGEDGKTAAIGDVAGQAHRCYDIIRIALEKAGAGFDDVIRTRTFLRDIKDWEAVAKVRAGYFKEIKPVETIMEISRFVDNDWLIEIEVDAIIDQV
jgi:enamine deaminase RidA (YjgF/YER057c/UK114 family)